MKRQSLVTITSVYVAATMLLGCRLTGPVGAESTGLSLDQMTDTKADLGNCSTVPYRLVSARDYANFPVWDRQLSPRMFAVIRNMDEYQKSFKGIFLPGMPARPPESLFDDEQILAVAMDIKAISPDKWDAAFTVVSVESCDGHLTLRYKINPIPSNATHIQSISLSLAINRIELSRVSFVDEETGAVELALDKGQWRHPPLKQEISQ